MLSYTNIQQITHMAQKVSRDVYECFKTAKDCKDTPILQNWLLV